MAEKKCDWCQEMFDARGRQRYCSKPHYKTCENDDCGKTFEIQYMKQPAKTCSKVCADVLSQSRATVEKECALCGDQFSSTNVRAIFCSNPHPYHCDSCGTNILPVPRTGKKYYSCFEKECITAVSKMSTMDKYGVDNVSKTAEVRQKISDSYHAKTEQEKSAIKEKAHTTNLDKYGVANPNQSEEIKSKKKQTNQRKYGVENPAQVPAFQEKARLTNQEKYGVDYAFQSEEIKEKIKASNMEKYGTSNPRWNNPESKAKAEATNMEKYGSANPAANEDVKEKIKATNKEKYNVEYSFQAEEVKKNIQKTLQEKYSVDNAAQSPHFQEKMRLTNLERYGVDNPMKSEDIKKKLKDSYTTAYKFPNPSLQNIANYSDYENFEQFVAENKMTIPELAKYFNITEHSVRRKVRFLGLDDHIIGRYTSSSREERFVQWLKDYTPDVSYIRNDRKILKGKELDFLFPEHSLAVEISPTSTHNSLKGWSKNTTGLSKSYHKDKFLGCAKQGIELITIFDWLPWESVMNMILHKLHGNQEVIYARKCEYMEENKLNKEIRAMVSNWHVLQLPQNFPKSLIVSTLKHDKDIVGVSLWEDKKDSYELKRMVFRQGTNVVGGASKMLHNFMKNNTKYNKITTFSDCDLGTGSIYKTLGFTLIEESKPGLNYYDIKSGKHIKYLSLVKQGADRMLRDFKGYEPVGIGDNLPSNKEIVESYGFLPVYDCGYRKWTLTI